MLQLRSRRGQRIVYRLPDNLSFEHAAMNEAVSVAVRRRWWGTWNPRSNPLADRGDGPTAASGVVRFERPYRREPNLMKVILKP
jgi:hypothetical protein